MCLHQFKQGHSRQNGDIQRTLHLLTCLTRTGVRIFEPRVYRMKWLHRKCMRMPCAVALQRTEVCNALNSKYTMANSKKKKSSLHISRPYAPRARNVRLHRNDNRTGSSTIHSVLSSSVASSKTPQDGSLLSKQPEVPEPDNASFEYTDTQHLDPAEVNTEGKDSEKSKRKRTMVMEEWLENRDTYLQEMLRHDGREGLQLTLCADCGGSSGDFSCYDCAYCMSYCQKCLVNRHHLMPVHRIKVCDYLISYLACEHFLALDRNFLRKDFVAKAGSSDPARSSRPIMPQPWSYSEGLHHR
jgi:hypothetical protein